MKKYPTAMFLALLIPALTNCSRAGIPAITNEPEPERKYPIAIWGFSPIATALRGGRFHISGTGFQEGVEVFIGDQRCENVVVRRVNQINCEAPEMKMGGKYPIKVINPDGTYAPHIHEPVRYVNDEYPFDEWYEDGNLFLEYFNY